MPGPTQTVAEGATVTLDSALSSDPEGEHAELLLWSTQADVTLDDATSASPSFTAPVAAGERSVNCCSAWKVSDASGNVSTNHR